MRPKQYSLLDYTISLTFQGNQYNIPLGGPKSFLGSISISKATDNITKVMDATGSGGYSFSADNSGTIDIELSMVSDKVSEILERIVDNYHNITSSAAWKDTILDITIMRAIDNKPVVTGTSCMLTKMPDLEIGPEIQNRTFSFVSLEIREHSLR